MKMKPPVRGEKVNPGPEPIRTMCRFPNPAGVHQKKTPVPEKMKPGRATETSIVFYGRDYFP